MKAACTLFFILFYFSSIAKTGVYLEYKAGVEGKEATASVLKIFSYDGDTYSEFTNLKYPTSPDRKLYKKEKPHQVYFINSDKTYFIFPDDPKREEYQVKITGNENIDGYNCTKVELTSRESKSGNITYVWITKEIPSYEKFLTANVNAINLVKLNDAMRKEGVEGIPVRIKLSPEGYQYDLVKAEVVDVDKSMFSLKGYKESKGMTSEEMLKKNKISEEQYKAMKKEELKIMEMHQKRDSLNRKD